MERLHQRDLHAALDFLGTVDSSSLDAFRGSVIGGLRRLVPCDIATYDEINPATGEVMWITDPFEHSEAADDEAFIRNISEHPVIEHHRVSRDGTPRTFSDFMTQRQLHSTALWNEFFRPLEIETQMATLFYGPSPAIVGLSLNGERRDFTARDRLIVDLLRPHLGQAFETALHRDRCERMLAALETGADRAGTAVVIVASDGRIEDASSGALSRLETYFGRPPRAGALPVAVDDWVRQRRLGPSEGTLAAERGGGTLSVRYMPRPAPAEPDALLIEERAPAPTAESLGKLGLTPREAEVLALIAAGRSNAEIGEALTISPLTAKKHAENIYAKLGTPGRAAAAARAYEASAG